MSRPAAWCASRKISSNGPPISPRPTTSTAASADVSALMASRWRAFRLPPMNRENCSDQACFVISLSFCSATCIRRSWPTRDRAPSPCAANAVPGASQRFDGLHKRLFLRRPVELVQLHPAPGRPFLGRRRIGQEGPDRPGEILRVLRFEKQQFVIGKVMPHRGDARADHRQSESDVLGDLHREHKGTEDAATLR